jgi:hypothetical protein
MTQSQQDSNQEQTMDSVVLAVLFLAGCVVLGAKGMAGLVIVNRECSKGPSLRCFVVV